MLPSSLLCSIRPNFSRKKKGNRDSLETEAKDLDFWYSVTFNRDASPNQSSRFSLRSDNSHVPRNGAAVKAKKKGEMATKVSNFSDLIQRVAASCLLHPLAAGRQDSSDVDAAIIAAAPAPELFEATMSQVKEASKSFTSLLLSLMREARWDISAAVRSIEAATATPDTASFTTTITPSVVANHHSKYALESYVSRKIFQGFDHETFYMDGSLSSLLNPDQYRRECFTQYRDMKAMDPVELLGILPTCHFGKFCSKKYLAIVHPKMEESLFGDLEQRSQVLAGNHPRSQFYGEFLGLAKAIWLLHLLAFSLDPSPSQFEASRGAEFHPHYMESVVKISGGRVPAGQIVGFPVSPGFKLGNGSVVKARVYLVMYNMLAHGTGYEGIRGMMTLNCY
ncbi:hypothetical protein QQP08_027433, partial [Theobroma cacao]